MNITERIKTIFLPYIVSSIKEDTNDFGGSLLSFKIDKNQEHLIPEDKLDRIRLQLVKEYPQSWIRLTKLNNKILISKNN